MYQGVTRIKGFARWVKNQLCLIISPLSLPKKKWTGTKDWNEKPLWGSWAVGLGLPLYRILNSSIPLPLPLPLPTHHHPTNPSTDTTAEYSYFQISSALAIIEIWSQINLEKVHFFLLLLNYISLYLFAVVNYIHVDNLLSNGAPSIVFSG